jgi:hypothetical protein
MRRPSDMIANWFSPRPILAAVQHPKIVQIFNFTDQRA